jgi:hemolysin activation/secretion protein
MKKRFAAALLTLLTLAPVWAQAPAAQPARSEPTFDVLEYVIEGNSVLPADVVERAVSPHLGPGKTFKDIEAARTALEKAYQEAGFLSALVSLPNQKLESGEVRLEVSETPVGRVTVTGAQYHLPSRLRQALPSLQAGEVPHFPQFQKELGEVQTAKMQVTPAVNASDDGQAIDIDLLVTDQAPFIGSFEFNNGQSFNTSRGRVSATLMHTNLFQRGHTLGLSWQYAPYRPKDTNTLSLIYGFPLNSRDDVLLAATRSDSDTPTGLTGKATPTAAISKGDILGLRWNRRLDSGSWPMRHSLHGGLEYKHNRDASTFVDGSITQRSPLRYTLFTGGYTLAWDGSDQSLTSASLGLKLSTQAMNGRQVNCNGTRLEQFDCKRAGSSADYSSLYLSVGHARNIVGDWRIDLSASVQLASGPLQGGEQFSLGGPDTVRGYHDFEQSGDDGWAARLELISPVWLSVAGLEFTALAFHDRGFVHLIRPQIGQVARTHMGSHGLGLRVKGEGGFEGRINVAWVSHDTARPVDNGARQFASGRKANRPYRVDVIVRQSF